MTHPLDGSRTKIARAHKQIKKLGTTIDRFVKERDVNAIVLDIDNDRRELVATFKLLDLPPALWAVIVGEILYDLRSALDHLAWQLVLQNGGTPTSKTEFPIFKDEIKFKSDAPRKVRGMSDAMKAAIQALQPYIAGENPKDAAMQKLWVLHELTNIDKHQTLHLAGWFLKTAAYNVHHPPNVEIQTIEGMQHGPLVDGAILAKFRWSEAAGSDAKMSMELKLSIDVTLKNVRPELQAVGIEDSLSQITIHVASRVSEFERFFV